MVSTKDRCVCLRSITVDGKCCGISSKTQNMAVSFIEPMMIQVMDLAGNVLNTISEDDKGTPVFSKPYYIYLFPLKIQGIWYMYPTERPTQSQRFQ